MLLTGKTALVTGAGQGIGEQIALTLAGQGCRVAVNDLVEERAQGVAAKITGQGGEALAVQSNVTAAAEVAGMFAAVVKAFGKLDILVNNAGIILKNPFWEISEAEWDRIMQVNVKSVFLCCQAAAGYMKSQQSGRIVNIASIAGKRGGGVLGNTAYAASKAGVLGLTKGLARELGAYGITVNAITPGLTETEMTKDLVGPRREAIIKAIALGRAGKPQDVANAVVFLASELAAFVSGEMMDVDGGFMMD